MPEFRCDAVYLSRLFSELGFIDRYSFPSTAGVDDLCAVINRFSPGRYAQDLRDEIRNEARDLTEAAGTVKRILGALVDRVDTAAPDLRNFTLLELGVDPQQAIAIVEGAKAAFEKAAKQMEIMLPVVGKTSAAKPWHAYVGRQAIVFTHVMATTNPGFVEAPNEAMMCRFLARVIEDRGDGPVTHTAVLQFLKRNEATSK